MTLVHEQNIVITCNRPEGPERAVTLVVHRRLVPEPLEIGAPLALPIQKRVTDIDVFKSQSINIGQRNFDKVQHRVLAPTVFLFAFISIFSALICKCMGTNLDVAFITFV